MFKKQKTETIFKKIRDIDRDIDRDRDRNIDNIYLIIQIYIIYITSGKDFFFFFEIFKLLEKKSKIEFVSMNEYNFGSENKSNV